MINFFNVQNSAVWWFDSTAVTYCIAVKLNINTFQALIRALLQKWEGFSDVVVLNIWKRLVSADRIDCRAELSEEKYPELLLTLYNFAGETNHVINLTQVTSKIFLLSSLPTLLYRVPHIIYLEIFEKNRFPPCQCIFKVHIFCDSVVQSSKCFLCNIEKRKSIYILRCWVLRKLVFNVYKCNTSVIYS